MPHRFADLLVSRLNSQQISTSHTRSLTLFVADLAWRDHFVKGNGLAMARSHCSKFKPFLLRLEVAQRNQSDRLMDPNGPDGQRKRMG